MDHARFDAIIFDCDGVLVDSEVIHIAAERELLAELGLEYDLNTYITRFVGLSNSDFYAQLRKDYEIQCLGCFPANFGDELWTRVCPRLKTELKPVHGAEQLVKQFAGPVAVASSASLSRLTYKLQLTNLLELFSPHIYSSEHVSSGKPAPDLFLHVASRLDVTPARSLVVEDSVNGVMAGRSAGMFTIGFVGGSHTDLAHRDRLLNAGAHFVAKDYHDLFSMFR